MMEIILALGGIFLFLANLLYLFRVELGARVLFALFRVIIVWEITIPHTLLMPFLLLFVCGTCRVFCARFNPFYNSSCSCSCIWIPMMMVKITRSG